MNEYGGGAVLQLVYSDGQGVECYYWYQHQESHKWQLKNELVMLIC